MAMQGKDEKRRIEFWPEQVQELEEMFPELVGGGNYTTEELRERVAQRSVVAFVRSRTRKFQQ